jgi:hypothetical protein
VLRRASDGALDQPRGDTHPLELVRQFEISKRGEFRVPGLPAGSWEVLIRGRDFGEVELRADATTKLAIDARDYIPGNVTVELMLEEEMPNVLTLSLEYTSPEGTRTTEMVKQATGGVAKFENVFAGSYQVVARTSARRRSPFQVLRVPREIEVVSSKTVEVAFHVRPTQFVIKVVQADGLTPVGNTLLHAFGEFCDVRVRTNQRGIITFAPSPEGAFDLRVSGRDINLGTLLLPVGATEHHATVRMPGGQ